MSAFLLKCIALFTMAVDHIGAVFFPDQIWIRYIGRLSFPIFAFLLTEGFVHTSGRKKYLVRLGLFALLSEVPYDLCLFGTPFDPEHQNIFFELTAGFLVLGCLHKIQEEKDLRYLFLLPVLALASAYAGFSYGIYGLAMISVFYLFRKNAGLRALSGAAATYGFHGMFSLSFPFLGKEIVVLSNNFTQLYAVGASVFLLFYNGERGNGSLKWMFYFFYPLHLLVLWGISVLLPA